MCRIILARFLLAAQFLFFCGPTSAFVLQNPIAPRGYFHPRDVAAGPDGLLYVAASALGAGDRAVQVFDAEGRFRFAFSPPEAGDSFPYRVAISTQGTIYATQNQSGTIRAFSPEGTLLFSTDGAGRIGWVSQIAVGANDELFALSGQVVHVLDAQGMWLRAFGSNEGGMDLGVGTPTAMETDSQGRIFIAGSCDCVSVFDPFGNRLGNFAVPAAGPRRMVSALAISGEHLYVGDSRAGIVDRYTLDGTFVDMAYGFPPVDGMGVGPNGEVYLAHWQARSVDRFTPQDFASRQTGVTRLFDRTNYDHELEILYQTGIGSMNRAAETTAETFIVPGQAGETMELTFSYFHKISWLRPRLGVFDRGLVSADPRLQPIEFAIQALEARLLEINKPLSTPPPGRAVGMLRVPAGTEIGFYMFPTQPYVEGGTPDAVIAYLRTELERIGATQLYDQFQNPGETRFPHFSLAAVNHGRVDQFVTFLGENFTVVGAEDNLIRYDSDVDLMDMLLSINARLIPVPEPATWLLPSIAGLAWICCRRR